VGDKSDRIKGKLSIGDSRSSLVVSSVLGSGMLRTGGWIGDEEGIILPLELGTEIGVSLFVEAMVSNSI